MLIWYGRILFGATVILVLLNLYEVVNKDKRDERLGSLADALWNVLIAVYIGLSLI
jgi:hypothetical protein